MIPVGESVAILFSGGTDSTLTAALLQENFKVVHLVTYDRFGFHSTDNTSIQAAMLKKKYGADRFVHTYHNVDKLFKYLSYENYFRNVKKHGFFNLSTCGLCKLSMHVCTIKYCLDNNIKYVADGANQAMSMEPAQMKSVIDELRNMYLHFDINYFNPVFEMDGPTDKGFIEKSNLQIIKSDINNIDLARAESTQTPGHKLHQLGLAPSPNVKGTEYDRKRQPRCFQFILFNIFAIKYFLATKTYEQYAEMTTEFYKDKIRHMIEFMENRKTKKYQKLLE